MKKLAVLRRFERKLLGIIIDRLRPLPRREERPLALVDRNADEPVPNVVLALKRFVRAVELEQHLLRDVVRFRAAFGVVERQTEHHVHILFARYENCSSVNIGFSLKGLSLTISFRLRKCFTFEIFLKHTCILA